MESININQNKIIHRYQFDNIKNKYIILNDIFSYLSDDAFNYFQLLSDSYLSSFKIKSLLANQPKKNQFGQEYNQNINLFIILRKVLNICDSTYINYFSLNQNINNAILSKLINIDFYFELRKRIIENENCRMIKIIDKFILNFIMYKSNYFSEYNFYTNLAKNQCKNLKDENKKLKSKKTNNNNISLKNVYHDYYILFTSNEDIMKAMKILDNLNKSLDNKNIYDILYNIGYYTSSKNKFFLRFTTFSNITNDKNFYLFLKLINENKIQYTISSNDLNINSQITGLTKLSGYDKEVMIKNFFTFLLSKKEIEKNNQKPILEIPHNLFYVYLLSNCHIKNYIKIICELSNFDMLDLIIDTDIEEEYIKIEMLDYSNIVNKKYFFNNFNEFNVTRNLKFIIHDKNFFEEIKLIKNEFVEILDIEIQSQKKVNIDNNLFYSLLNSFPNIKYVNMNTLQNFQNNGNKYILMKKIGKIYRYYIFNKKNTIIDNINNNPNRVEDNLYNISDIYPLINNIVIDFTKNKLKIKAKDAEKVIVKDIININIISLLKNCNNLKNLIIIDFQFNNYSKLFKNEEYFAQINYLQIKINILPLTIFSINQIIPKCFNNIKELFLIFGEFNDRIIFNLKNINNNILYDKKFLIVNSNEDNKIKFGNEIISDNHQNYISDNDDLQLKFNIFSLLKEKLDKKQNKYLNTIIDSIIEILTNTSGIIIYNFECFKVFVKDFNFEDRNSKIFLIKNDEKINNDFDDNENITFRYKEISKSNKKFTDLIKAYIYFNGFIMQNINYNNNLSKSNLNEIIQLYFYPSENTFYYLYEEYKILFNNNKIAKLLSKITKNYKNKKILEINNPPEEIFPYLKLEKTISNLNIIYDYIYNEHFNFLKTVFKINSSLKKITISINRNSTEKQKNFSICFTPNSVYNFHLIDNANLYNVIISNNYSNNINSEKVYNILSGSNNIYSFHISLSTISDTYLKIINPDYLNNNSTFDDKILLFEYKNKNNAQTKKTKFKIKYFNKYSLFEILEYFDNFGSNSDYISFDIIDENNDKNLSKIFYIKNQENIIINKDEQKFFYVKFNNKNVLIKMNLDLLLYFLNHRQKNRNYYTVIIIKKYTLEEIMLNINMKEVLKIKNSIILFDNGTNIFFLYLNCNIIKKINLFVKEKNNEIIFCFNILEDGEKKIDFTNSEINILLKIFKLNADIFIFNEKKYIIDLRNNVSITPENNEKYSIKVNLNNLLKLGFIYEYLNKIYQKYNSSNGIICDSLEDINNFAKTGKSIFINFNDFEIELNENYFDPKYDKTDIYNYLQKTSLNNQYPIISIKTKNGEQFKLESFKNIQ